MCHCQQEIAQMATTNFDTVYQSYHFCPDFYRLDQEHHNHTIGLFTLDYEVDNLPYETALEILLA